MLVRKIIPYLLLIFFIVLYVHNLSRSVYGGDVGDFVTTAAIGGVAHAPGYPLFTFLGFVMIHALPLFTPAFAMGLISAFSGALGVVICFLIIQQLTKNTLSSVIGSITLGVSYLYWFYSEIAEVFALHALFLLLLFYFAILFDKTKKRKFLYLFACFFGLAAVTHQTVVLFVPSFLFILIPQFLKSKKKLKTLFVCVGIVCSAFLWYIYVLIASSHHPAVNWDNVHDVPSFLRLLLRQDYGTFKAGVFVQPVLAQRLVILRSYLFTFLSQVTIPVIFVSLVGALYLWRKSKRYVIAFFLAFVLSGPVFVGYSGFPLQGSFFFGIYERFFGMSTLTIFLLFGCGLYALAHIFSRTFQRSAYFHLLQIIFLIIPLQLFIFNMQKTDLSHIWIGDTLGQDLLRPLPPHALLLIGGDTALFNTWYVHYALHVRPDVHLVNLSLASLDPFIAKKQEIVRRKNHNVKGNELVAKTLAEIAKTTPVFSYDQLQAPGKTELKWIPTGLLYRLSLPEETVTEEEFLKEIDTSFSKVHFPSGNGTNYRNLTIAEIPQIYAKPVWAIGNYLLNTYKDPDLALKYYSKAIAIDPNYESAYVTKTLVYLTVKNDCKLAVENIMKAKHLVPYDPLTYFLLYTSYSECYHDKVRSQEVVTSFKAEFHEDFYEMLAKTLKQYKKL